jgi:N-acetyl-anhydromuramyl-L-alanine amidase AmpD
MTLIWRGSPNYQTGREGLQPTDIVLHWMDGGIAAADARFQIPAEQVSATYGVQDSLEYQWVSTLNTAWHAGTHYENLRSVGIEHAGGPNSPVSANTISTSIARMVTLIRTIPTLSVDRIYRHSKFVPTQCPGTLPVESMIASVRNILGSPLKPPTPPAHPGYPGLLRLGSTGAGVLVLQRELAWKFGYRLVIDSIFGPVTQDAVRHFQAHKGLVVDGLVGPLTWGALWG